MPVVRPRAARRAVVRPVIGLLAAGLAVAGCSTVQPTAASEVDTQATADAVRALDATGSDSLTGSGSAGPDVQSQINPFDPSRSLQRLETQRRAQAERKAAKERAERIRARKAKKKKQRQKAAKQAAAKKAVEQRPRGGMVFGDSVALGAQSCLAARGYSADAVQSRTFSEGFAALRSTPRAELPQNLVIHLGTNGPFGADDFHAVMSHIGSGHHVTWVTISLPDKSSYAFEGSLNEMIKATASQYTNTAIADWNAASAGNDHWFYADMIHINGSGCEGFAETVDSAGR